MDIPNIIRATSFNTFLYVFNVSDDMERVITNKMTPAAAIPVYNDSIKKYPPNNELNQGYSSDMIHSNATNDWDNTNRNKYTVPQNIFLGPSLRDSFENLHAAR